MPGRRERDVPCVAVKQRATDLCLELLDLAAERGLSDVELRGRTREVQLFAENDESRQQASLRIHAPEYKSPVISISLRRPRRILSCSLPRYRATALPRQHPTGRQPSNRERIPIGCRTSRVCDGRAERWWILSRLGRVLSQVLSGRGRLARGGCPLELQGETEDQGSRRPQRRQAKDAEYRCWYRALEEQQAGVAGCQSDD